MTDSKWPWRYFKRTEMACKHCGTCHMSDHFMDLLDGLRGVYGKPMVIVSGYRCQTHNTAVGGGAKSAHLVGRAVDISVSGEEALRLIALSALSGFTGFGVKQKGNGRFVHIDDLPASPGQPRPHIWSY